MAATPAGPLPAASEILARFRKIGAPWRLSRGVDEHGIRRLFGPVRRGRPTAFAAGVARAAVLAEHAALRAS